MRDLKAQKRRAKSLQKKPICGGIRFCSDLFEMKHKVVVEKGIYRAKGSGCNACVILLVGVQ